MIEERVTLETARLAKEKGYPNDSELPTRAYYHEIKYFAPTQSLLQRWLRDVHNIHIIIVSGESGLPNYDYCVMFDKINHNQSDSNYAYEEALEKALQEGLRLINTKQKK